MSNHLMPHNTHRHFWATHRTQRASRTLVRVVAPYVECGFDSDQIYNELRKQTSDSLVTIQHIEEAISIAIGEQQ